MKLLPHWVLTDRNPAFYDTESGSAIEQTAKVYKAMQEMIGEYNTFVDEINSSWSEYRETGSVAFEEFQVAMEQKFSDFIKVITLKYQSQDLAIDKAVGYMEDNLHIAIQNMLSDMRENGEITDDISKAFNDINTQVSTLETNLSNLSKKQANDMGDANNRLTTVEETQNTHTNEIIRIDNKQKYDSTNLSAEIENLNSNLNDFIAKSSSKFKNIVCIGDSFLAGYGLSDTTKNWGFYLSKYFNSEKVQLFAHSGLGFAVGTTSYANISDYVTNKVIIDATEKDNVTDIFIMLGTNDSQQGSTRQHVSTHLKNAIKTLKSNFINANIHVFNACSHIPYLKAIGEGMTNAMHELAIGDNTGRSIKFYVDFGNILIAGPWEHWNNQVTDIYPFAIFGQDIIHPTQLGQELIGNMMGAWANGNKTYISYRCTYSVNGLKYYLKGENGKVFMRIGDLSSSYTITGTENLTIISSADIEGFKFLRVLYGDIGLIRLNDAGQLDGAVKNIGKLIIKADGSVYASLLNAGVYGKVIPEFIELNFANRRVDVGLSAYYSAT